MRISSASRKRSTARSADRRRVAVYGVIGVGRDDGRTKGEYAAILYRRERFHVAESGTFWFSDTPEVVASRSWGNTITRICTWARLIDRGGQAFWIYNVHLDHQSQPSRERSTRLLAERIAARAARGEPVVVTGDFNVGEDNPALTSLLSAGSGAGPRFVDTFRVRHPDAREVGTFTGFTSARRRARRSTTSSSSPPPRCSTPPLSAPRATGGIRRTTFRSRRGSGCADATVS
jgi:endonuclease/exonuclease/phosphatase family metal-dependent hydrolase